jgi:hypothetical protein
MAQSASEPNAENRISTFLDLMSNSSPHGSITKELNELPFINNLTFIGHHFLRTLRSTSSKHRAKPHCRAMDFATGRLSQHLRIGIETLRILRREGPQLHSRKLRSFDEPPFRWAPGRLTDWRISATFSWT